MDIKVKAPLDPGFEPTEQSGLDFDDSPEKGGIPWNVIWIR